jgi:hypothetical protein
MSRSLDEALARLDDYVRGGKAAADGGDDAPGTDVAAYEEDLFARALAGAAPELAFRGAVGEQLRTMDARGTLDLWLTARGVDAVVSRGLRVVQQEIDPQNPHMADLPDDFDILITRVPLDLSGVRRLEAEILGATGERLKLMPDIEFDPADGAVFMCCEAELARAAAASEKTVTRVWAHDDSGRRLIGEIRLP